MENKDIVLFEKKEDIAFMTFNRPEAMNALSTKVNIRLVEILDMAEMDETLKIAKQIASKSSVALALIKSAMNRGTEVDLETGFQFEMDCFGLCFTTEEQKQAMKTFVKK